jgi:hypothetical protein
LEYPKAGLKSNIKLFPVTGLIVYLLLSITALITNGADNKEISPIISFSS